MPQWHGKNNNEKLPWAKKPKLVPDSRGFHLPLSSSREKVAREKEIQEARVADRPE